MDGVLAWAWQFAHGARAVKRETHLHEGTKSCFKYNKKTGAVEVCRHLACAEGEDKIAADTIAFVEEDEDDGTVRQVDAAD